MKTAILNDAEIHYADEGPRDAPALVFANSLGTDLRLWDALAPHLPDHLRVVRYDKRGHGLSQETPGPYSIDGLADDAAALITHLALKDVVFVGLSIGGMIGLSLAVRYPDMLRALVVSNSAAKIGDASMWEGRIAQIRAEGVSSIGPATMERWFSPSFREAGQHAVWQRMLERQPAAGYMACCQAIADADLHEVARAISMPVQMIAGTLDGSTPPALVKQTAKLMTGARYAEIADAGHLPCVEAPTAYAEVLTTFLREIGHV